eukprot:504946-Pelagomonas_calceolata.AAC.4
MGIEGNAGLKRLLPGAKRAAKNQQDQKNDGPNISPKRDSINFKPPLPHLLPSFELDILDTGILNKCLAHAAFHSGKFCTFQPQSRASLE